MFSKILIANRGEIAVRIIRACRDMGISTVGVYSEADRDSLHVRMSDEAYLIGEAPSSESYLRHDRILDAAKKSGAKAIHPGYGFLSENPEFVRSVVEAGLVFIGPTADIMKAMGGKISARKIAAEAGATVVPGSEMPLSDSRQAIEIANEIGFPVMLKASAGGGGKGMRLIKNSDEMPSGFDAAKSEALASFGDDSVYLEKAIVRPRHIEIQIMSDSHGNHVHLGERECSIQRRHQKVIEESPSPIADPDLRERMGAEAVKIAKAVGYVGAGTVEFLVSDIDKSFYFLEMNTRLQVEHPVTELVTGIDLVREQIRVADGKKLSFEQDDISIRGHAIECRVYAEDPENDFLPSPGMITKLRVPQGNGVRDDSGVYEGGEVSIYYDPLISKFCTYGRTRTEAIERMARGLREYHIGGIKTTLPLFREIMADDKFISGELDTGFIADFFERRETPGVEIVQRDMAIIAAGFVYKKKGKIEQRSIQKNSKETKWRIAGRIDGLRSGAPND